MLNSSDAPQEPPAELVRQLMKAIEAHEFHLLRRQVVTVTRWGSVPNTPNPGGDRRLLIPEFSNGKLLKLWISDTSLGLDGNGAYQAKVIQRVEGWLLQEDDPPEEVGCYQ